MPLPFEGGIRSKLSAIEGKGFQYHLSEGIHFQGMYHEKQILTEKM